jgi:hypothetical protein
LGESTERLALLLVVHRYLTPTPILQTQ